MATKAALAARLFLGLIFLVFGLNGFLQFLPMPPLSNAEAQAFIGGLAGTGYFFPFLKGTEVLISISLLSGFYAPLALIVSAPIVLNIFLFHRVLAPGTPLDVVMLVLLGIAAWGYRDLYRPVLSARI